MNTKHTPGKIELQFERDEDRFQIRIGGRSVAHFCGWSYDGVTTKDEDEANAARLAMCWNMHDELAEALRGCITDLGAIRAMGTDDYKLGYRLAEITDIARAVLAKLEGGAS